MTNKTNKEFKLSIRTLNTMAKQGIGHGALKDVVKNLQKNTKKSKK